MIAVRLPGGELWVHSPIALEAELREELEAVGRVGFLVAPSLMHDRFAAEWAAAFPQATLWLAPGLAERRRDLPRHGVLGHAPEPAWASVLDQHPVAGMPRMNEVVFLHRPTRTLILTDLAVHFSSCDSLWTRAYLWANHAYGRLGCTYVLRLLTRDREAARRSLDRILEWDFDRVIMSHGQVLERDGPEALRRAFAWL